MVAQVEGPALLGNGVGVGSIEDGLGTETPNTHLPGWCGHRAQAAELALYLKWTSSQKQDHFTPQPSSLMMASVTVALGLPVSSKVTWILNIFIVIFPFSFRAHLQHHAVIAEPTGVRSVGWPGREVNILEGNPFIQHSNNQVNLSIIAIFPDALNLAISVGRPDL